MNFASIVGQRSTKEKLQKAIQTGHVSHAYLFCGQKGSGKRMLAEAFVSALLCSQGQCDACMQCQDCIQIQNKVHPDVIEVSIPEGKTSIPIKDVREKVIDTIEIRPFRSHYKIYMIDGVDTMKDMLQNVLLKSLEESPSYVIMILLAQSIESILPTIQSRCTKIHTTPVSLQETAYFLEQTYSMEKKKAMVIAKFSFGNLGKAKTLARDVIFSQRRQDIAQIAYHLSVTKNMYVAEALSMITERDRQALAYDIELLELWFRDVLLYKATKDTSNIIYDEYVSWIKEQASIWSYQKLDEIQKKFILFRQKQAVNVDGLFLLETIFTQIKEIHQ